LIVLRQEFVRFLRAHALVKIIVAHHDRSSATARQAFHELDGEFAVLRCLDSVRVRVQVQLLAKMFMKFVRTAEGAAQGAANLELTSAGWFLAKQATSERLRLGIEVVNLDLPPGRDEGAFLVGLLTAVCRQHLPTLGILGVR
jgi:hypothetical protein